MSGAGGRAVDGAAHVVWPRPERFEEFGRRYLGRARRARTRPSLEHLRALARHGTLTLLTATKRADISEAVVLADLLGIDRSPGLLIGEGVPVIPRCLGFAITSYEAPARRSTRLREPAMIRAQLPRRARRYQAGRRYAMHTLGSANGWSRSAVTGARIRASAPCMRPRCSEHTTSLVICATSRNGHCRSRS